mmetsp:Transcript_27141/g.69033  ORF Transcript_27141/g.69033 Transcript_27141/m.69033 type:complete len:200 (-) Transcript_27141:604-1203(-)
MRTPLGPGAGTARTTPCLAMAVTMSAMVSCSDTQPQRRPKSWDVRALLCSGSLPKQRLTTSLGTPMAGDTRYTRGVGAGSSGLGTRPGNARAVAAAISLNHTSWPTTMYLPDACGVHAARQCAAATTRTSFTPKPMRGHAGQKSPWQILATSSTLSPSARGDTGGPSTSAGQMATRSHLAGPCCSAHTSHALRSAHALE